MRRGFPVLFLLAAPLCGQAVFQFSGLDDGNGAQPLVKAMGTACPGAINAKCPLATLQLGNTVIHMDDAHGNVFDGTITLNLQTTTPPLQAANPGVFQGTMPVAFALSGKWQHPALPTGQEAYWYTVSYFGPNFPIRDQDPCNTNQTFSPEQMVTGNGPETVTFTSSCTAMANLDWSGSGGVVTQLTGWAYLTLNLVFGNDNDEILLAFEFHYAPPAVSTTDTATISSTTPAADSTVDFNSPFTVAASGQVTLASQSQAQWALRLYDQNNILQATSTPANISSGTPTTVSPTVSVSSLPSSVSWLKARLEVFDPATSKVLVQSQPDVLIHAAPAIRIEALQVVQTTSNTVNLKTGAPVVYRVFLSSRGTGSDSKAYSGTLSGAGQGAILVGAQTMAASQNPSRESLTNSLNFVDTHATVGPATVTFNLTDAQGGSTGITKSAPLTFVARTGAPPSVDVQILCYQALGMTMDCSVTPHLPDWISSDITLNVLPDWLTYTSDLSKPDNQAGLLQFLAKLYLDGQLKGHTGSQLVGFLPDLTALNLNGSTAANVTRRGYSPVEANIHQNWGVAWVQNNSSSLPEETMLHEIAHGFGLLDTGNFISPAWELLCGGPAPDPNWPFADATINDPGYIVSGLLPSTSIDVMSHCPAGLFGSYILASSYTYNKLLQATGYRSTAPVTALEAAKTAASEAAAAGGTAVLVSGTITTAGSVTLDPLHSATVASLPPAGATAGAYCVVLTGATTERSCFDLSFQITDPTQPGGTVTLTQQGFAFLMHQPDSLQQVAVTQGNSTLLSRTPSAHAPTVNITAPAANAIWSEGTNTVSWQGADADNNPLWYSLAYSPDGGTSWYSLVLDTQQTQWNVATSEILGGKNVRFRVTVSDGLLGSTAEVGPVTVQQMPALTLPAAPFAGGSTLLAVPLQVPVPLKSSGTGPLSIQSATISGTGYSIIGPPMPLLAPVGATLNLNVQFLPVQSGSFDGTLTLVSNDSANPTQTLRITSIADSSPTARISVSPSSIVFSGVSVGQSASALLTVASQGTAPLVVSSAKFSTTEFSLGAVTLPATLVAGQQSFELRFTPSAAGVRTGILTLATNDPKNATLTVLLAGMGLALSTTAAGQPALRLQQPFLQTFNGRSDVSGNTWLEIYGSNFASKGRAWTGADFQGSQGPTSLDGWSVAVNGKPAVVYYISPGQINVNVPDDTVTGPVPVQVKGPGNVISNTMTVNRQTSTPALQTNPSWTVNGTSYVVAVHPDSTATQTVFVGPPGLIPGVAFKTVKPGGTFSVYAVGCGPANGVSAGVAAAGSNSLSLPHEILIGGVPVLLLYDGYAPGAIGLVQFNVVVPNLPPGNYPIELIVNGVSNGQGLMINIGQ